MSATSEVTYTDQDVAAAERGFDEMASQYVIAPWFWRPFQKIKWWFCGGIGIAIYSTHSYAGSPTAAFWGGWMLYAALYGLAGILTMLYAFFILRHRDPGRFAMLYASGAQARVGPNGKGMVIGVIVLLFFLVVTIL